MKMKHLKWGDFLSFAIAALVVGLLAMSAYGDAEGAPMVLVETDEDRWIYPLDGDQTIEFPGSLGNMVVKIHGGMVDVSEAPCRDKLCVQAKPLKASGDWVACLPGRVFIRVRGEGGNNLDGISF